MTHYIHQNGDYTVGFCDLDEMADGLGQPIDLDVTFWRCEACGLTVVHADRETRGRAPECEDCGEPMDVEGSE